MKISYDGTEIELSDVAVSGLVAYAEDVMRKMQAADPEYADCWTACEIELNDTVPDFMFGSIEDIKPHCKGVYVEQPITQ